MKFETMLPQRRQLFALVAIALCAVAVPAFGQSAKKSTAAGTIKQYTIEQFLTTTAIGGSSFSPDEKSILFSSNKSGIYNVYTVPVTGGEPKQLTRSTTESTFSIAYFPNDSRILYTHDQGGNENNHIYVLGADGKEKDLTPGDKVKAQFVGWTHDGKAFYISTNERDQRFFDIYKLDAASFERKLFYQDSVGYQLGDISDDERFIAFAKANTTSDSDVYLYNVATKEMKNITPHQGDVASTPAVFDPRRGTSTTRLTKVASFHMSRDTTWRQARKSRLRR